MTRTQTKPWHQVVALRDEIRNEELSQKQFAADLYDVVMGRNLGVYHDPKEFFSLTYPTVRLRDLARDVTHRLAGKSEKAVRQLHMTFGGGKTHALITLVHLTRDPASLPDIPAVQQFKAHCAIEGGLPRAHVAAVVFDRLDAEKGMEVMASDRSLATVKMPWSAIAWQLAGSEGMKLLKDDGTERTTPPATGVMEDLLKLACKDGAGVLILFDEVLWFVRVMADTDPKWIGRMREFMHSLTQAVAKVPQCCLVASLLASDPGKMDELGKQISKDLYDEFKRVADEGIQPVESQDVPEILRRRLLKLESYTDRSQWGAQVVAALNGIQAIDDYTAKNRAAEEKRFGDAYPFHPALIETLYQKWTQLEGFQQTRGILKTLASALRDAVKWDQQPLIGPQIFLVEPGAEGLSVAARELANVAQLEQYEGRRQNWTAILEAELAHARKAQEGLLGVRQREIEQAVMATFLHSQPIGQRATTRELKVLIGVGSPDGSMSFRVESNTVTGASPARTDWPAGA
jgi:predicted AAA+ superfamily ATPase